MKFTRNKKQHEARTQPTASLSNLLLFRVDNRMLVKLPLASNPISAGFPSPAEDHLDASLDLNKELIKNKSATFYGRVKGDSMIGAGISNGDLLVIDKSIEPRTGSIAVCFLDGEFTIKRIQLAKNHLLLIAENDAYPPIKVTADNEFVVWGVVTAVIKSV